MVIFVLVSMLVGLFSNLYALTNHRTERVEVHLWDYLVAAFNVYAATALTGDSKVRKHYPYGVGGLCLMALVLMMRIAAHWAGRSIALHDFLGVSTIVVSIGSSLLILAEGARWLRRKITLA